MYVVAHNLASMNANRMMGRVSRRKDKNIEKLSSGYRINRSADDAAGLQISEKLRAQIRGNNRGSRNSQDGISLLQVADGALNEVNDMLHRITELSVQAANDTNTTEDRDAIQKEINELISEIDRIGKETEFNTMPIFDDITGNNPIQVANLVKSDSAKDGYLKEAYAGSDGKFYPAANLDFSDIDSTNIDKLYGKSFSFNCSLSCGEVFKFSLVNMDGTKNKVEGLNAAVHEYTIDIHGMTTGAEIVNALYNYVNANKPKGYSVDALGNSKVSHTNSIAKVNANTLSIYSNARSATTEEAAKSMFPRAGNPNSGKIDISQLVDGDAEAAPNKFWIQSGPNTDEGFHIEIDRMGAMLLGISALDVSNHFNAGTSISKAQKASEKVAAMRSKLGAEQNRLEHAMSVADNSAENLQASESRIRDTDMAKVMAEFAKENILEQAGQAMIAQANQQGAGVIELLNQ